MYQLDLKNYHLNKTLLGGQTHVWDLWEDNYIGFFSVGIIKISKEDDGFYVNTYPHIHIENVKSYLNYDTNLRLIHTKIDGDKFVKQAIKANPGLRILRQDFEETLLMFILTQHKNIKAIRKSLRLLTEKFGKTLQIEGKQFYLFPKTEVIAEATIEELLETGIGFRAKYLKSAAQRLLNSDLKSRINDLNEEEARGELKEFYGVGDKVADCVLSFSLGFDNVTPLDVWSMRILRDLYGLPAKMKYDDMRKWTQDKWSGYAAWAGHYLWEWYREL